VNGFSDELLAGAALPGEQNADGGWRYALDAIEQLEHLRARAYQFPESRTERRLENIRRGAAR
jgi:hypothetical protein